MTTGIERSDGAIAECAGERPPAQPVQHRLPADVPVSLIGPHASWFTVRRQDRLLRIAPTEPLSRRCVVRPAALFQHGRGFPDVNTVMGKLLFAGSAAEAQAYEPYTLDEQRRFRELMLLVEASPDDELPSCAARWRNYESVAKRLLGAADVVWSGLSDRDLCELVDEEAWHQPVEGCVLHALAEIAGALGQCVIEVGSLKGQSLAMLGRGLRAAGSGAHLVSIDPHIEQPHNREAVRHNLARIGEQKRLVQFQCTSDEAAAMIAPQSCGLVFIDGDHAYSQVVADFKSYAPLLARGGILAFHDYGYGPHNGREDVVPGVRPAIDALVMSHPDFEPLLLAHTLIVFRKTSS